MGSKEIYNLKYREAFAFIGIMGSKAAVEKRSGQDIQNPVSLTKLSTVVKRDEVQEDEDIRIVGASELKVPEMPQIMKKVHFQENEAKSPKVKESFRKIARKNYEAMEKFLKPGKKVEDIDPFSIEDEDIDVDKMENEIMRKYQEY